MLRQLPNCPAGWLIITHLIKLWITIPPEVDRGALHYDLLANLLSFGVGNAQPTSLDYTYDREQKFAWQNEYGVFSLGGKQLETAIVYVCNQKEHHQERSLIHGLEPDTLFKKLSK